MSEQRYFPGGITVIAIVLGCLSCGSGATAQDDTRESGVDGDSIEEIVVTGTRIKRRDFNTPSPMTTISKEDIAFT